MNLRPYQTEIAFKGATMLADLGIIYLSMQTRTGKTITAFEICRLRKAVSVLFVTKKKAISSIEKDYLNYADYFKCTVINYESVSKVDQHGYDIAIIDEAHSCFVGNTKINGKKIKDINLHSNQKSFNFDKNKNEKAIVINKFKKKLNSDLVKIICDGKKIVCTEDHEIYTRCGWKKARDITNKDELFVL